VIGRAPAMLLLALAAAESSKFYFEYTFVAGPADVAQHLVIRDQSATVMHEPGFPSAEGDTIGIFRVPVSHAQQERLAKLMPDRAPAMDVPPDSPSFSFHLQFERRDVLFVVPNNPTGSVQVAGLMAVVNELTATAMKNPYRSLSFEVLPPAPVASGKMGVIRVRLRDAGSQPVRLDLNDAVLRIESTPPPSSPDPSLMPKPVVWSRVDIAPWREPPVMVEAHGAKELAIRVKFSSPGVFLVRAWFARAANQDTESPEIGGAAISTTARINVAP
jgi:hypothetical protein